MYWIIYTDMFYLCSLDLSPFISNPEGKYHYELYATINHSGSVFSGHCEPYYIGMRVVKGVS